MLLKLAACFSGTFCAYLVNGLIVEAISVRYGKELFAMYLFMVLVPCLFNAVAARLSIFARERFDASTLQAPRFVVNLQEHLVGVEKGKSRRIPQKLYALCAMIATIAMICTNASLAYIDFPTQLLLKSSKPVAIMFVHFIVTGYGYPWQRVFGISIMVLGVIWFMKLQYEQNMLLDDTKYPNASMHGTANREEYLERLEGPRHVSQILFGWLLVLIALLFDGLQALIQESMRQRYVVDSHQLMYHLNKYSIFIMGILFLLDNEIPRVSSFVCTNWTVVGYLLLLGISSAVGQQFIFWTVTEFGPLTVSVITTTRKFFNMFLSIIVFTHVMTNLQFASVTLVFIGIAIDTAAPYKQVISL